MTRRRDVETAVHWPRCALPHLALLIFTAGLGACASLPDDAPVVEQLEVETGVTVTRLGHPIELYRETFRQDAAGRFAFLGPFETNLMGSRESFLWISVPMEVTPALVVPVVEVDGVALALGAPGLAADFAGLHGVPYKIPTPWNAKYFFKIDATIIQRLAEAKTLTINVTENTGTGTIKTEFAAQVSGDARLREFAAR